ncbi:hypothetical protein PCYB_007320, partial [Plasmodium cynomolgi strain B]
MPRHLTEEDIDNLTSKIKYSYFEDGKEGCEKIQFYLNISDEFKEEYQIYDLRKIYEKIVRALCYIYKEKKKDNDKFDKELCWYLYYWLGDKIYSLVQGDRKEFSKIISKIYWELNENNPDKFRVCEDVHYPIDQDIFDKNKILFEYSMYYEKIKLDTTYVDTTCDKKYKDVLQNYIDIYSHAYENCNGKNGKIYDCSYFHKLFPKDKHEKLISFNCRKQNTTVPSTETQRGLGYDSSLFTEHTSKGGTTKTIIGSVVPVLGGSFISFLLYK